MGFATHLGPWLLGTVKNTTGTTSGTVENMGCTVVTQSVTVSQTDSGTVSFGALPAGAMITGVQVITPTTAFTSGTISISVAGTALVTTQNLPTALGVASLTIATTGGAVANNVGSTDALVTYTLGTPVGSGAATTLVITYVVRASNGAQLPSGTQN
jgi:hypothetical protein